MSEDQSRQTEKMEAIGRLAGGVAHDFNNLLTVIRGCSDLLLKQTESNEVAYRRALQIRNASERAASLVEQLLAFSRGPGRRPGIVHLNTFISGLETELRGLLGDRIRLLVCLNPDAGYLEIEPERLQRAILNLARNSREAMPNGGALTIATAGVDGERRSPFLKLTVSDTGVGMNPVVRSHLFEPFFTTKEMGKAAGLGLFTVYGIVKEAGGHISVASEPGSGTAFDLYFPAVAAPVPPAVEAPSAGSGDRTILVCEDEEMVRWVVCETLRDEGYQVLEAGDGREALSLAEQRSGPVDLVLTDMVMPHMGGHELSQHLNRIWTTTKVVYMSGYSDVDLAASPCFLKKPFTPEALLEKVRSLLER